MKPRTALPSKPALHARRPLQRGVAAIEFAFVSLMLLILLYGIATFGAALYTQQAIARAAEDGVRAATLFTGVAANDARVRGVIYDSLASSIIAPAGTANTDAARRLWLQQTLAVSNNLPLVDISAPGRITVSVVYPYSANPILPAIPLTQGWIPTRLTGRATADRPVY